MRSLTKLKIWTGRLFRRPVFGELSYVGDWPELFSYGVVYVQEASSGPWSLAFECPSGCKEVIYLNLLRECRPAWSIDVRWFEGGKHHAFCLAKGGMQKSLLLAWRKYRLGERVGSNGEESKKQGSGCAIDIRNRLERVVC